MSSDRKPLKAIYAMHSIQGFASSMIGIFIPIYLLTLNYSIAQVIKLFLATSVFLVIFAFAAIFIARFVGLQQTILARTPFTFIYYCLLYLVSSYHFSLYYLALFGAIDLAMYWVPLHILFTRNVNKEDIGSSTGKLLALPKILSAVGPLIGGFIAVAFGFKILLVIVFLLIVAATAPLIVFHTKIIPFKFEIKKGIILYKQNVKFFWAEVFDNIGEEVEGTIWPIFVYLTLLNVAAVGMVGTLLKIGSIIFILLVGKYSDKYNRKKIIKIGAICLIIVWFARYFVQSEFLIYVITIISGFVTVLFLVPFTAYGYALPKKETLDEFFVFREIPVGIGRIIIYSIALFLVTNIKLTFLIASSAYLYFLFF